MLHSVSHLTMTHVSKQTFRRDPNQLRRISPSEPVLRGSSAENPDSWIDVEVNDDGIGVEFEL